MKLSHILTAVVFVAFALSGCSKKSNNMNKQKAMTNGSTSMSQTGQTAQVGATAMNSTFTTSLEGGNEVPNAVKTDAGGEALFRVNSDSTKIYYTVNLSNVDSVKMAHIHYGTSKENGPIAVWLYPGPQEKQPMVKPGAVNGTLKKGVITKADLNGPFKGKTILDLVHAIDHDSTYVQIHTAKHPEGEIRGQLTRK
ncbi:MAG TPA: CHRD domain-containing protein [Balneolales bacterium]|nr:CHRD domain-containing protein [Balneolales bacterium]